MGELALPSLSSLGFDASSLGDINSAADTPIVPNLPGAPSNAAANTLGPITSPLSSSGAAATSTTGQPATASTPSSGGILNLFGIDLSDVGMGILGGGIILAALFLWRPTREVVRNAAGGVVSTSAGV